MLLHLLDAGYTDRLAAFLRSLGQVPLVSGPAELVVETPQTSAARHEMEIYLRVWRVLYPEAEVTIAGD